MTIVDRSGPGVRITLLDNERAPSGEPLDLAGRIIAFTYEDAEKKADQVSLQLDNFDLALFERAELVGGATLEVSWGYPGNMAPPRRVVVKKLKGFQTLTIEGQATSVLMNREAKTRSWANKSRADVVREIAAEHGYEGEFLDVEDTGEVLDTISQSAETDARFLRRLAAREEYEYFVDDTGFHWRSRDQASAPKHVLTWFSDPGRGDIISVSVESDLQRRAGRVEVRGRDPLAKTTVESAATSATVERATLSDVLEVVDRETGETSLQERNATTSVHPTSAPTPAAAERESAARFRRAERETVKLALQVVGDPRLLLSTLSNLVQNAIKFSGDHQRVVLRARASGDRVNMEIEDRCGGLADGVCERMFQPFVQHGVDRRGVGLGLSIARRAVEAHGGTIGVRNMPGVGCVFSVCIPNGS